MHHACAGAGSHKDLDEIGWPEDPALQAADKSTSAAFVRAPPFARRWLEQDDAIVVVPARPRSASSACARGPGDQRSEGDVDVAANSCNTVESARTTHDRARRIADSGRGARMQIVQLREMHSEFSAVRGNRWRNPRRNLLSEGPRRNRGSCATSPGRHQGDGDGLKRHPGGAGSLPRDVRGGPQRIAGSGRVQPPSAPEVLTARPTTVGQSSAAPVTGESCASQHGRGVLPYCS